MSGANSRNYIWSLLVIGVGVILLLLALDVLPPAIDDLLRRSWGILLVIAGLNMLLIDRLRLGNWIALFSSFAILGGIIFFAYQTQSQEVRTDYVEEIPPILLGENIVGANIDVQSLSNTVVFQPSGGRAVGARFVGSSENNVTMSVQQDENNTVTLDIDEVTTNDIPQLDAIGRGELQVFLPTDIPIETLNFDHQDGVVTLDLRFLDVPRLDVESGSGDMDIYLPESGILIGDVVLGSGNLRLIVSPDISMRLTGAPSNTTLDGNQYQALADGTIESRGGLTEFQFNVRLGVSGSLQILTPQELQAVSTESN